LLKKINYILEEMGEYQNKIMIFGSILFFVVFILYAYLSKYVDDIMVGFVLLMSFLLFFNGGFILTNIFDNI
jgi:hypothetical protein